MQSTSALYRSILANEHYFETRLIIDNVATFGEGDLFSISTNLMMFSSTPVIGKAVSGEIEVRMAMQNKTIPVMARLRPQVRVCGQASVSDSVTITAEKISSQYFTRSNEVITVASGAEATVSGEVLSFPVTSTVFSQSEWLPQGVFFIDTRETTQNSDGLPVLTIHGYDAMLKTEQIYTSNAVVGDDYDTAYVAAIASAIGVSVDNRTWQIMGTGTIIPFPVGYSMREILGYIAATYVGCFVMTDEGKLRLVALPDLPVETNLLIDEIGDVLVFGEDAILI